MKSCLEKILNPFSAVIKIQKEFANDVIENVKKQRDSFSKHHREMALRRQELHLDELEEHYKCCVCGRKGQSRDFEPPVVLVNAMAETVTGATTVVAKREAERKTKRWNGVVVVNGESHVSPSTSPKVGVLQTSPPSDAILLVGREREHSGGPALSDGEESPAGQDDPSGVRTDAEDDEVPPAAPVTAKEVQMMIKRARRELINAQKFKRLEEKHRKHGSYHKDKGLTRIHETDVAAFSAFFQKPVRGFLCTECHDSAKRRLDVLTEEVQYVIAKAQVPFTRLFRGTLPERPEGLIRGCEDYAARHVETYTDDANKDNAPTVSMQALDERDITSLRQLKSCGICRNRNSTHFSRNNVLFMCGYCCAMDRFYRRIAICINDEPMDAEVCTLLQVFARAARGDDDAQATQSQAMAEANAKDFPTKATLFGRKNNLFISQDPQLCTPLRKESDFAHHALFAVPDFTPLMEDTNAEDREAKALAKARALARSTTVSLFQGLQLAPHVDLFEQQQNLGVRSGSAGSTATSSPASTKSVREKPSWGGWAATGWGNTGPAAPSFTPLQKDKGRQGPSFDTLFGGEANSSAAVTHQQQTSSSDPFIDFEHVPLSSEALPSFSTQNVASQHFFDEFVAPQLVTSNSPPSAVESSPVEVDNRDDVQPQQEHQQPGKFQHAEYDEATEANGADNNTHHHHHRGGAVVAPDVSSHPNDDFLSWESEPQPVVSSPPPTVESEARGTLFEHEGATQFLIKKASPVVSDQRNADTVVELCAPPEAAAQEEPSTSESPNTEEHDDPLVAPDHAALIARPIDVTGSRHEEDTEELHDDKGTTNQDEPSIIASPQVVAEAIDDDPSIHDSHHPSDTSDEDGDDNAAVVVAAVSQMDLSNTPLQQQYTHVPEDEIVEAPREVASVSHETRVDVDSHNHHEAEDVLEYTAPQQQIDDRTAEEDEESPSVASPLSIPLEQSAVLERTSDLLPREGVIVDDDESDRTREEAPHSSLKDAAPQDAQVKNDSHFEATEENLLPGNSISLSDGLDDATVDPKPDERTKPTDVDVLHSSQADESSDLPTTPLGDEPIQPHNGPIRGTAEEVETPSVASPHSIPLEQSAVLERTSDLLPREGAIVDDEESDRTSGDSISLPDGLDNDAPKHDDVIDPKPDDHTKPTDVVDVLQAHESSDLPTTPLRDEPQPHSAQGSEDVAEDLPVEAQSQQGSPPAIKQSTSRESMDAEPPSAHPPNNQTITTAPLQDSATPSSRISRSESPKDLGFVPSIEPAGHSPTAVDATRALGFVSWTQEDEAEVHEVSSSSTAPLHQQQKRDEYDFFSGTATFVQTQYDDNRDEGAIAERRVDSLFPMSSPNPDAQYDFTATHQLSDDVADSSGALVSSSAPDAQNNDNNLVDPFVEHHSVPHTYGSSALSFANDDDDDDDLR